MKRNILTMDIGARFPYELETLEQELPLKGLPPDLHGAICVHLTDLHAGCGNIQPVHEEMVRQVKAIQPDIILYTGDYVDRRTDQPVQEMGIQETLNALDAPLGKYAVFGNHDHLRGIVGVARLLERANITPLLNESLRLDCGLWLAGIDDVRSGSPHIEQALRDLPPDQTALVLTHNPSLLDYLDSRNITLFAGHTHGAQIVLPFPPPWLVCRLRLGCRYVAGWYQKGDTRMYVSRGIGMTRRPYRYHCPAEIAVFRLVPAEANA